MNNKDLKGRAPSYGYDVSDKYMNSYRNSHYNKDQNYRLSYISYIIIENILDKYKCLDIGCGTAGFVQLMDKCTEFVGIDYSKKMLGAAEELMAEFKISNYSFFNDSFENYSGEDSYFDVIRLGVYGSYQPHSIEILKKTRKLLNENGLLLVSYAEPKNIRELLLSIKSNDPIKITNNRFIKMLYASGYKDIIFKFNFGSPKYIRHYMLVRNKL